MNEEKLICAAFVAMSVGSFCAGWLFRSRDVANLRVRIIEIEHEWAARCRAKPRSLASLIVELPPRWIRWLWRPLLACGLPAPMRWVKPLPRDADSTELGFGDVACLSDGRWVRRRWFDFGRNDGKGSDECHAWWRRIRKHETHLPRQLS